MSKRLIYLATIISACGFLLITIILRFHKSAPYKEPLAIPAQRTFWKYQCIDTMKTSRDKARTWPQLPDVAQRVEKEIRAIKNAGSNCVAIDTPYDDEFLPYLKLWVGTARENGLSVWFRGNFSSWEGWFGYARGMTTKQHRERTSRFIKNNRDIFADGDIFTPNPEAENGGPYNQVEIEEYPSFRNYLIEEYTASKNDFASLAKDVAVNWLSMNGGLAKRMLDKPTVTAIGGVVTIDHYIKAPEEMTSFISYFSNQFGSHTVIGEFGAPIPDINGTMTDDAQANFVAQLLHELYKNRDKVDGINYWTLSDGSTALLNPDYSPKPVYTKIQQYFKPVLVYGRVANTLGEPLDNIVISTGAGYYLGKTNNQGYYELLLPAMPNNLMFANQKYQTYSLPIKASPGEHLLQEITLEPQEMDPIYKLRLELNRRGYSF